MPELQCDLVMKGGITSGTVYPKAIVRLAAKYRLRCIGGTSAGAIAAGVAAASEYRRQSSGDKDSTAAFDLLDGLPVALGTATGWRGQPKLLTLFQPQWRSGALFRFLLSLIGMDRTSKGEKSEPGAIATSLLVGRVCLKAIWNFWLTALAGGAAAAGVLRWLDVPWDGGGHKVGYAIFAFAGASAGALYGIWLALQALPDNGFGLCRGFQPAKKGKGEDMTQLTMWLHDLVQRSAGRTVADAPLTFGDLKTQGIELRAMTTNLCYGLPHRLPLARGNPWAFFDETAWRDYFPEKVVTYMKGRPPPRIAQPQNDSDREYAAAVRRIIADGRLAPFPAEDDFPVIVAVRMSLSFPILLSAVPVRMLDPRQHDKGEARLCWFSDGGISSNFPLHFFDSPLPGRPTFAINLNEVDTGVDDADRIMLPKTNREGLERAWKGIPEDSAPAALAGFLLAIFNVMQNWRDNSLLRLPGYRDRVATVQLEPHEGGLNLNMPDPLIRALAGYGERAAAQLLKHFHPDHAAERAAENIECSWDNHRWVRMLTSLTGLQRLTGDLKNVWEQAPGSAITYRDLLDPAKTQVAPSYTDFTKAQREFALKTLADVQAAIDACREAMPNVPPMDRNTPRPAMHFRLTQES